MEGNEGVMEREHVVVVAASVDEQDKVKGERR